MAAVLIGVTQHIGQEIVTEPPPLDYGSITAPSFDLANVTVGGAVNQTATDSVVVVLTADGADKYLHLELSPDILYSAYEVKLTCTATADETAIAVDGTIIVDLATTTASHQLGTAGTYTFDETITATAGGSTGVADVVVDVSLQDI